jgi:transcriptional regulator with XRE-family HTH domain
MVMDMKNLHATFWKTPGGEELATLPRAELEELVEVAAHNQAMADYRAGRDPGLTMDEVLELLDAPTPLAFWRRKLGVSQAHLAAEVGIAQNYVSDLETGKAEGSPSQWLKIADALGLSVEDLIRAPEVDTEKRDRGGSRTLKRESKTGRFETARRRRRRRKSGLARPPKRRVV